MRSFRSFGAIDLKGVPDYKDSAPTELQTVSRPSSFMSDRARKSLFLILVTVLSVYGCIKRARTLVPATANEQKLRDSREQSLIPVTDHSHQININTASANELETLPGIGKGLAERIIEHREKYGPFRKPEHLIIVRGISDKRYRALREFITVE